MKSPQDHWNNLVKTAVANNPNITQTEVDAMKPAFVVCFTMMSHEFAIEDPQKILDFAKKIAELFGEKKSV